MKTFERILVPCLVALILLVFLFLNSCDKTKQVKEERGELKTAETKPEETKGAPYPPAKPSDRIPNEDVKEVPVPDGPKVGDMKPENQPLEIIEALEKKDTTGEQKEGGGWFEYQRRPLYYRDYAELTNSQPATLLCCPEVSVAENGQTIMMTGNVWMALSEDGGATFSSINPTTIFPQSDGGLCCDQVVLYVPRIDMFVWLMQYWTGTDGKNRIRIAAQTTAQVRSSNGTAWTYWDFPSTVFSTSGALDYNDMTYGTNSLWWTTQSPSGRVVVRISLDEIAAKGTINYSYTGGTDALWSHITHDAGNTVYWAGHVSNSELRVYSWKEGDGFYSWRSVTVNSWPNGTNTSVCPDGTDWMTFESWKHYVFGNTVRRGNVWFSWLASAGGGFPNPHVQMVRINTSTWNKEEQVQIWNPDFAFLDAYLSMNSDGELGMDIAFGGGPYYPSNAVGVWGDFVVYYPRLSTRATGRWGNYNTCRRSGSDGRQWVAGGYTMDTDASGDIMLPHYIRFSR